MDKKILFISEYKIKDETFIEPNVDSKILNKVIFNVQDVEVKNILTPKVYNDLYNHVKNSLENSVTIPEIYQVLLYNYVHPYMKEAVLSDFLTINNYKVTNKGLLKMRDDVAVDVNTNEKEHAKSYFEKYKTARKDALIEYLYSSGLLQKSACDNSSEVISDIIGWYMD